MAEWIFLIIWISAAATLLLVFRMAPVLRILEHVGLAARRSGARFLDRWERRKILSPRNDGLLIDGHRLRLSARDSFTHLALIAPTGAGKTTRFVIPNVLTLNHCSMVVTDPSGEIYESTAGHLRKRGFRVRVLNLARPDRSLLYNPLSRLKSYTDISETAHILIRASNPHSPQQDSFWDSGAETILTVIIGTLVAMKSPEDLTLANALHQLQQFGPDGSGLDEWIAEHASENIYRQYRGLLSGNPKVTQSFVSVAMNSLAMLNNPEIADLTRADGLDFEELRRSKTALFLIVPSEKIGFYSFLMNLFYSQLFQSLMARLPRSDNLPVYCLMDEFGHTAIPHFDTIATTIRKFGVSLSIILQSTSQLAAVYGRDRANTILSGWVAARLVYPGVDMETAQHFEKMMGRTIDERTLRDGSVAYREGNLMNADRIRTLPDGEAVVIFRNREPLVVKTKPSFR